MGGEDFIIAARTVVALTVGLCVMAPASLVMAAEMSRARIDRIAGLGKMSLTEWRCCPADEKGGPQDSLDDSGWRTVNPGFEWSGDNTTVWFRKAIVVPERIGGIKSRGCRVIVRAAVDDDGEIYVNGELKNRFHWDDGVVLLTEKAEPGEQFAIALRGMNTGGPGRLLNASLEVVLDAHDTSLGTRYVATVALLEAVANRCAPTGAQQVRLAIAASLDRVPEGVLESGDAATIADSLVAACAALDPVLHFLKQYTVHMIGNAHIDSAWLWRWPESVEVCKATYRSALDIMSDYPDFTFACSSAAHYLWTEQHAPEIFEEIKKRVKEDRWEIVGGWWVQPDVNVPSGESFVRQALYGQRYFWEKFGKIATVGYNPDSFGHTGTLPQLLAKCGISSYLFFRPGPHEKELPPIFWWEAPDGTRVLASRPPHHYAFSGGQAATAERIEGAFRLMPENVMGDILCFYGVGDHGGGPTRETVAAIAELSRDPTMPGIKFGNLGEFYGRVRERGAELPVVSDELQHHASGCYAVHSEVKRRNRKCEELLLTAERIASFASAIAGVSYDTGEMERAWRHVLFNQFHDILAGTSIAPVYDDADEMYDEAEQIASQALTRALDAITERIDTEGDGQAIVVFNPLAWDRKGPVEIEIPWQHKLESLEVRDADGNVVPVQRVRAEMPGETGRVRMVFVADVPSLGYGVYRCLPVVTEHVSSRPASAEARRPTLENRFWRVEIDPRTGAISRLFDRTAGVEVFVGNANVPVVMQDMSDTWSHGVFEFHDEVGRFGDAQVSIVERGPVRSVARIESRYGQSTISQDLILYEEVPVIESRMTVDWHEQWKLLKLAFRVNVTNPTATYQIPYGFIERPTDGEEEPAQQWIDVTGTIQGPRRKMRAYGVSLLNDCKYSFDVSDGTMSMTVLRSPPYALHDPRKEEPDRIYEYIDQGIQHLAYRLVPHEGSWRDAGTVRYAAELNAPFIALPTGGHGGELPQLLSFITVRPDNVVVTVVKRSEDSADLILRLYETAGKGAECTVNMVTTGASWTGKLAPNEIKTLKVSAAADGLRIVETDMLEGLLAVEQRRSGEHSRDT